MADGAQIDWTGGAAIVGGRLVPVGEAAIGVTDWGLTHSDITYDVATVWDGRFFRLGDYLERFAASMCALRIEVPEDERAIRDALHRIVGRAGLARSYVSMVASRGAPRIPGSRDPRDCANHFYCWCVPYVHVIPEDAAARGVHLKVARAARRIPDDSVSPRVKNYHWGDFTQGLFEAKDAGYDTAVLLDHQGHLTEGPGFNVFAIAGDRLMTPERGCLHGITRRVVFEIAEAQGLTVESRDVALEEAMEADEVFVATSGGGPSPVVRVDDRTFGNGAPGPRYMAIREAFETMRRDPQHTEPVRPFTR